MDWFLSFWGVFVFVLWVFAFFGLFFVFLVLWGVLESCGVVGVVLWFLGLIFFVFLVRFGFWYSLGFFFFFGFLVGL